MSHEYGGGIGANIILMSHAYRAVFVFVFERSYAALQGIHGITHTANRWKITDQRQGPLGRGQGNDGCYIFIQV